MKTTFSLLILGGLDLAAALAFAPEQMSWAVFIGLALFCPLSACAFALTDSAEVAADLAKLTKERFAPRAEQRKP